MQGQVIAPGSGDERDSFWGIAAQHALKGDAQCMYQVGLDPGYQRLVGTGKPGDRQRTQEIAQRLQDRAKWRISLRGGVDLG